MIMRPWKAFSRASDEELEEWGCAGEDHLFLSETRTPLTINGVTLLFARLRKRAGITDKRISPHIFRHTFAIRYLVLGNDPFSLQELLGHEDMTTVKNYMHMNDETIQQQKRKYSPGDHLPTRMPGPRDFRPGSEGERRAIERRLKACLWKWAIFSWSTPHVAARSLWRCPERLKRTQGAG